MNKYIEKFLDTWIDEKPGELIDFHYKDEKEVIIPAGYTYTNYPETDYYHSVATSAGNFRASPSVSASPTPTPTPSLSFSISSSGSYSASPSMSPSYEYRDPVEDKLEEIKRDIRKFLDDTLIYYSYTLTPSDRTNINNFLEWYLSRLYGRREISNGKYGMTGSQIYVGITFPLSREYFLRWNVCPIKGIEDATVDGYAPPTLDAELEELFKWEED